MRKILAGDTFYAAVAMLQPHIPGFDLNHIQTLTPNDVVTVQSALGYGKIFGIWETPRSHLSSRHPECLNKLNLRHSIERRITAETAAAIGTALPGLLDEAELWLARYVLMLKVGPAQIKNGFSLYPATIIRIADRVMPQILVQGMLARSIKASKKNGLVGAIPIPLSSNLREEVFVCEFSRMRYLNDLGLWSDILSGSPKENITNPFGAVVPRRAEATSEPYPPLTDSYLTSMGPRVMWVLETLAPQILRISREIVGFWHPDINSSACQAYISTHLHHRLEIGTVTETWIAPFRNETVNEAEDDAIHLYPHSWREFLYLLYTIQGANLWISLLATAGRIGEVMGLKADCVQPRSDGKLYASGHTYKFSASIFGDKRDWLAPDILLRALKCQRDVVEAFASMRAARGDSEETRTSDQLPLWLSFTNFEQGTKSLVELGSPSHSLNMLAGRLGVDPKSDGQRAHPHRFRKTISKLVGTALVDGPRVLMRVLGHKDIAVAIEYILSDKQLQSEIDKIAREIRIIRCKDVLQDLRLELHAAPAKLSSYGGGAIPDVKKSIVSHEEKLKSLGLSWVESSAYDLAKVMTLNGENFRYLKEGVICTKIMGKVEPCNCNSTCVHRIEAATDRRDIEAILPILLRDAEKAIVEGHLLVAASIMDHFERDALQFEDIFEKWRSNPRVSLIKERLSE